MCLANVAKITDAGVSRVAELTQLQELDLAVTNVSDVGVTNLKGLHQLSSLDLSETAISDRSLESLEGLASLRHLNIYNTPKVSERAVHKLKQALPNCWIYEGEPDPGPPIDW